MAVIRCPHCGKPNPEFLDVCQYCDAALHESAASGAGQPAAPAEENAGQDVFAALRTSPGVSDEEAEAQPAAELPDWLSRLGSSEGPAKPAQPAEEATGKISSWLDNLRSAEATEQAETPDWYWTGTGGEAEPPGSQPAAAAEELPDWLRSLNAPEPAQGAPAEPEAADLPDWLRGVSAGTTAPPGPSQPAATSPFAAAPAEELPDWLRGFGAAAPAAQAEPAASTPPTPPSPLGAPPLPGAEPAEELPEWLQGIGGIPPSPAGTSQPTATAPFGAKTPFAAEGPLALEPESGVAPAPAEALPGWLQDMGALPPPQPEAAEPASPLAAEPQIEAAPSADGQLPDWLRTATAIQPGEETPALGEVPDWLQSFDAAIPEQPPVAPLAAPAAPEAKPVPEDELPAWLRAAGTGALAAEASPLEGRPTAWLGTPGAAQGGPAIITEASAEGQPEWLQALGVTAPAAGLAGSILPAEPEGAEQPEWLRELSPAAPVSAGGTVPSAVSPFGAGEAIVPEAAAGQLPDWLTDLAPAKLPAEQAEAQPAVVAGAHLATAALPSWLEAMRPVEAQRPEIAPEVDEYEETVGVLAGLRGVLRAQPSAAQPGKSAVQIHKLETTEAQIKRAAMLTRTVSEASETRRAMKGAFWQALPLARLAVFAVLFLAFVAPLTFPAARGFFQPAQSWNTSAQASFDIVDDLSPAQPALLAFDYDPAQAGELDPLAQAFILHLQRRGVPVVGISTSPAGAVTGEALFRKIFDPAVYGSQYVNLGYLPGGPVGMLQITTGLQPLFPVDFRGDAKVWETDVLRHTRQLNDFGVIILVSATPDTVRAWVEQLQNYSPRPDLIAAVSAGAEPLVRPYYDTDPARRQLKGLVSGILGAAQYERQSGVAGLASGEMWDALGWGLLVVIVLLIGGNVFYGLTGAMRRQKR